VGLLWSDDDDDVGGVVRVVVIDGGEIENASIGLLDRMVAMSDSTVTYVVTAIVENWREWN